MGNFHKALGIRREDMFSINIAKTFVILDCEPWDDETDMDAMLKSVKTIEMDGLLWGACTC